MREASRSFNSCGRQIWSSTSSHGLWSDPSQTAADFAASYNAVLKRLTSIKRRNAEMLALQSVRDDNGAAIVSPDLALKIAGDENESVPEDVLDRLFHADQPRDRLIDVEERLERFLFERTI
jgi:hypothetical protein